MKGAVKRGTLQIHFLHSDQPKITPPADTDLLPLISARWAAEQGHVRVPVLQSAIPIIPSRFLWSRTVRFTLPLPSTSPGQDLIKRERGRYTCMLIERQKDYKWGIVSLIVLVSQCLFCWAFSVYTRTKQEHSISPCYVYLMDISACYTRSLCISVHMTHRLKRSCYGTLVIRGLAAS